MERKASINFQPITNPRFAVAHSERTGFREPGYLLPAEFRRPNIPVPGSMAEGDIIALFDDRSNMRSRQAKTSGASPFWEGVMVLDDYSSEAEIVDRLNDWKAAFESMTGMRVLHMEAHQDEGELVDGVPVYNRHAHIIIDRFGYGDKMIALKRRALSQVQDMTADKMHMKRGETLSERGGRRGRKHVGHKEWRYLQGRARDGEEQALLEQARAEAAQARLETDSQRAENARLRAQIQEEKDRYSAEREALKSSGQAVQADYQELKRAHELRLAELKGLKVQLLQLQQRADQAETEVVEQQSALALVAVIQTTPALPEDGRAPATLALLGLVQARLAPVVTWWQRIRARLLTVPAFLQDLADRHQRAVEAGQLPPLELDAPDQGQDQGEG